MEPWQGYNNEAPNAGGSRRYNGSSSNQMSPRDYTSNGQPATQQQQQPQVAYKYEQYQQQQQPSSSGASPMTSPQIRDGNGDVAMPDAHDYSQGLNPNMKQYPIRSHHQHHLSAGGRTTNLQQEPSAAAQRYSPMEVLSPTSPYKTAAGNQFTQHQTHQQRQSPTRSSDYVPQNQYYGSRHSSAAPPLPPINPYASGQPDSYSPSAAVQAMDGSYLDPKSPKRAAPQAFEKGPVPEFKQIRGPGDLKPKINAQPPFRRANPEGGFISVSGIAL